MKILSVADIHGSRKIYHSIKDIVKEQQVDVLILPGDLYPKPEGLTFETFQAIQESSAQDISELLEDWDIPIFYVLGNDDWTDTGIASGLNLNGKLIEHMGVYFTGFEYVNKTSFNTNRELSENRLKKMFQEQVCSLELNTIDHLVVIAHSPLFGKRDKLVSGKFVGSRKLGMEIEKLQPMLYLCGHIHEAYGDDKLNDTTILNCASSYEIDLLRGYLITIENSEVHYQSIIR
jgi:Icc-related predicted phosphoesterase